MKKRILPLALALVLCLGLAAPAFAAGTTETVTNETQGVVITIENVLRKETNRYNCGSSYENMTIYVVEDNSKITVEAMEGRKYSTISYEDEAFWAHMEEYAYRDPALAYEWDSEENIFWGMGNAWEPMAGPETYTAAPAENEIILKGSYSPVYWMCESDFAKLVPFEGKPISAGWAQEDLEKAYDAQLFPQEINPYEEDCSRGMTRAEFAETAVNLYAAMLGEEFWNLDLDRDHPFTDVLYNATVGYAYNLGFVTGTSKTTFSPDETLTREQAAVMLARVYAKIHGDIPDVTATTFADDGAVSSWAKSSVSFMADKGIVKGVGSNAFAPQQTLSIQEAIIMAQRMLENLK